MASTTVLRTIDDSAFARRRKVALANTDGSAPWGGARCRDGAPQGGLRAANRERPPRSSFVVLSGRR